MENKSKIAAIILAAGKSERMGSPKAFLEYRGGTFLSVLYATLKSAPLAALRVVFGHRAQEFSARAGLPAEEVVLNPRYESGMLSSVQAGLKSLEALAPEAVMLFPVDQPAVSVGTIARLIDSFRASGKPIVLPVHGGRRGHPALFGKAVFEDLLHAPEEIGARAVVRADRSRVLEVPVEEPAVLLDIDTPDDYRALKQAGADSSIVERSGQ
ncbi:nucleotidyltransferase family protein [bacterium]|nr:nucleotidyltransferase family protein [bacterium]